MKIDKKSFFAALSQIRAHRDVIVLRDSVTQGCLDILYVPKTPDAALTGVGRMTVKIGGEADLFDDPPAEKLGGPILVWLGHLRKILKDASYCDVVGGRVNGIDVEVKSDALPERAMFRYIADTHEAYSKTSRTADSIFNVPMRRDEYSYMAGECPKFVSRDATRYFLNGVCFDFDGADDDRVNIVATDGRKLCLFKHKLNGAWKGKGEFIIPPAYLHVPASDFESVDIGLFGAMGRVSIRTADYVFEGLFKTIDMRFPDYKRIIPEISESTQWFELCVKSFRMTMESVKGLMDKSDSVYLNAENPGSPFISVGDGAASLEVEGSASRPMRLSFLWPNLSACLFDGIASTRFYLDGSGSAMHARESRPVRGLAMETLKMFMPTTSDEDRDNKGIDEFRMPVNSGKETT